MCVVFCVDVWWNDVMSENHDFMSDNTNFMSDNPDFMSDENLFHVGFRDQKNI